MFIRRAGLMDVSALSSLLNEIISEGGTTALTNPTTADDLATWMERPGAIWHLAEGESGDVMGFQWVNCHSDLGDDVASIATFTRIGSTGLGVGSALFAATEKAARLAGFAWINADIRADNESGLAYYQSRGFEDWSRKADVILADGTRVDKVLKRYELR